MSPLRVVSLLPSATEMVAALGCESWLVGRSHECDCPSTIKPLPVCTSTSLRTDASSAEIDRQVKNHLAQALSLYDVDGPLLQQLRPDVIITQTQCAVCAVSLDDLQRTVCQTLGSSVQIVALEPHRLADIWHNLRQIATALRVALAAETLIPSLQQRLHEIHRQVAEVNYRPTVVCIEWLDPLMSAGNWVPELVELPGGTNLLSVAGQHSPWMTLPDVKAADPDLLV
ncbi:MAG: cobalamin-binding protein, partial [Planctomycetes bacterium]|nr:cobalamin-binding protein [Planctomycetota bacterium]